MPEGHYGEDKHHPKEGADTEMLLAIILKAFVVITARKFSVKNISLFDKWGILTRNYYSPPSVSCRPPPPLHHSARGFSLSLSTYQPYFIYFFLNFNFLNFFVEIIK